MKYNRPFKLKNAVVLSTHLNSMTEIFNKDFFFLLKYSIYAYDFILDFREILKRL